MPVAGDLITAVDFNALQSAVYSILGNGSGQNGYGNSSTSSPVSAGTDIIVDQWASLKADILKAALHQGTANLSDITNLPNTGSTNDFYLTLSDYNLFLLAITVIQNNKFALGTGQYSDENLFTPSNNLVSDTRTTAWGGQSKPTVTHAFSVDFDTADNARYFFNAGGSLRFSASLNDKTTSQNRSWHSLLKNIGTIIFNHSGVSAVTGTTSSIGFYNLTTTPQTVYSASYAGSGSYNQYISAAYSSNIYEIKMRCDIPNNSNGGARHIYVQINFNDYHQKIPYPNTDKVAGTLSSNVTLRRASGTYINTAAPTGTITTALSA
jgi:hypothetical protein